MVRLITVVLLSGGLLFSTGCSSRTMKTLAKNKPAATKTAGPVNTATPAPPAVLSTPPAAPPMGGTTWKDFKSNDNTFSVRFPGEPKSQSKDGEKGKETQCMLEMPDGTTYAVVVNESVEGSAGTTEGLKSITADVTKIYGAGAKLESQKDVTVAGQPGLEYTVSMEEKGKKMTLRSQAFFAHNGHQLFQLMAGGPGKVEADTFFSSFQLGSYTAHHETSEAKED